MPPEIERILVLVRATPEESKKYGYTVCVAGLNENNEWRRLYPFKFRYGNISLDFRKKDIIEVETISSENDKRKESRKVTSHKNLFRPMDDDDVRKMLDMILSSIDGMDKNNDSLCVIKPVIEGMEIKINSTNILDQQVYFSQLTENFLERREKVKMPLEARYIFRCGGPCCKDKSHEIKIIDWEINELARNVFRTHKDKATAESKIRLKFLDGMQTRDVYFIIGTHFRYKTPMIIGIFYPKRKIE